MWLTVLISLHESISHQRLGQRLAAALDTQENITQQISDAATTQVSRAGAGVQVLCWDEMGCVKLCVASCGMSACSCHSKTRSHLLALSCAVDLSALLAEVRSGKSTSVRDAMQWIITDVNAMDRDRLQRMHEPRTEGDNNNSNKHSITLQQDTTSHGRRTHTC